MNIVEMYQRFATQESCIAHLEKARWKSGVRCPYCKSTRVTSMPKQRRHHCNACNTSFSVTVGTIFHKTKADCQKWFVAVSLMLNTKKGISARQLARDLDVNKNTAWYMAMRIRRAMVEAPELLSGVVEMDETYDGPRGPGPRKRGCGTNKTPVVGIVERGGKIRAKMTKKLDAKSLVALVRENIDAKNTPLMTDEYMGHAKLASFVEHKLINHKDWYVDGDIHTNTIESLWVLLKRGIVGQFHKVNIQYLQRYIDEFHFRHNYRVHVDALRLAISKGLGVA